jgi:hypothetical protein
MWQDEDFYNPDFQDPVDPKTKTTYDDKDLYFQPIGSTRKILNAITGEEYPFRIGSKDEKRFYIIMQSDPWNPKEACRLYFKSPKEYEDFTGNKVSEQSWTRFRKNQELFR